MFNPCHIQLSSKEVGKILIHFMNPKWIKGKKNGKNMFCRFEIVLESSLCSTLQGCSPREEGWQPDRKAAQKRSYSCWSWKNSPRQSWKSYSRRGWENSPRWGWKRSSGIDTFSDGQVQGRSCQVFLNSWNYNFLISSYLHIRISTFPHILIS